MEDWTKILPSAIRIPVTVYRNQETYDYWIKMGMAYLDIGKTNILVLGRPATGKSVLISQLYGEVNAIKYNLPPGSTTTETKAIQFGYWTKIVRTIPGQSSKNRSTLIEESLKSNKKLNGILYVVDYGYTMPREQATVDSLINKKDIDTIDKLREHNLRLELDELKEALVHILHSINVYGVPSFICIVVNKLDLFHEDLSDVQNYYDLDGDSEFSHLLREFVQKVGSNNCSVSSMPTSSFKEDFEWNGQRVVSNIGGDKNQSLYLRNLLDHITKISQKR